MRTYEERVAYLPREQRRPYEVLTIFLDGNPGVYYEEAYPLEKDILGRRSRLKDSNSGTDAHGTRWGCLDHPEVGGEVGPYSSALKECREHIEKAHTTLKSP